jgi:hypothetical protein
MYINIIQYLHIDMVSLVEKLYLLIQQQFF